MDGLLQWAFVPQAVKSIPYLNALGSGPTMTINCGTSAEWWVSRARAFTARNKCSSAGAHCSSCSSAMPSSTHTSSNTCINEEDNPTVCLTTCCGLMTKFLADRLAFNRLPWNPWQVKSYKLFKPIPEFQNLKYREWVWKSMVFDSLNGWFSR